MMLRFEVGEESVEEVGAAVLAFGADVSAAVVVDERDGGGSAARARARGH